jgi:hypothetical protein
MHARVNTQKGDYYFLPFRFEQDLIYHGILDSVLTVDYREFSNGIQRTAFDDRFQYNLAKSDTISFKAIKIKILSATSQKVNFVILSMPKNNWEQGDVDDIGVINDLMQ